MDRDALPLPSVKGSGILQSAKHLAAPIVSVSSLRGDFRPTKPEHHKKCVECKIKRVGFHWFWIQSQQCWPDPSSSR